MKKRVLVLLMAVVMCLQTFALGINASVTENNPESERPEEFIVIEKILEFSDDGVLVEAYSTLTDSQEEILLASFNGWSIDYDDLLNLFFGSLFPSTTLPFTTHKFYRVVSTGKDGGYDITDAMPLAQSATLEVNNHGYIVGTDGVSVGNNLSVDASYADQWIILDNRTEGILLPRQKVLFRICYNISFCLPPKSNFIVSNFILSLIC